MHLREHVVQGSVLAGLDARVKLVAAFLLLGMVLSSATLLFPVIAALFSFVFCLAAGISRRSLLLRYLEPLLITAVLITLKALFSGSLTIWSVTIGGLDLAVHEDGLREGLLIGSRILGAVGIMSVLGFTTPFNELLAAFAWFRIPRGFVEVLLLAYRYIFLLFDEASTIYQAQKNRLGYATLGRGFRSFGVLAGSLTIKAFEHSQNTALSMAQRGYDGSLPTGRLRPFRLPEVVISSLFVAVVGVLWKLQ